MLLALVLAYCSSDLVRLSVVGIRYQTRAVSIPVHGLAKQTTPNSLQSKQPVVVSSLDSDSLLCAKACLKEYVLRTSTLRKGDQPQLFIGVVKPHKPIYGLINHNKVD